MSQPIIEPPEHNPNPNPPNINPNPPNRPLGGSPGLLTSTGGLFGINGVLLTPVINNMTGKSYILLMDSNDFNCEESAEYDFPQEIPPRESPQEGRDVNCHLIILKYRELGTARFNINVTTFEKDTDKFTTYSFPVIITALVPDNKIHTRYISISVPGERPQVSITRFGNTGPLSITSLTLCGNADTVPQF